MKGPQPEAGIHYLDSVYAATPDRSLSDIWKLYNAKANYYAEVRPNMPLRWVYIDSMQDLLNDRETRYPFEYTHTELEKGAALKESKKYEQAFKCYIDGREFAAVNLDSCSLSEFDGCLGIVCYQQEEFLKAIPFVKQAYEDIQHCPVNGNFYQSFIIPQALMNTAALCYERAKLPDSAIVYYYKALQCITEREKYFPGKENDIAMARGVVEGNLGGNYIRLKNFPEAEKHLRLSISINDHEGRAIEDAQTARTKLADLYLKLNRWKELDTLLATLERDIVSQRGKSLENDQVVGKWINLKWHYYEKKQDIPHAYEYMKRYRAFDDSMTQLRKDMKHVDLKETIKDQENAFQLALLKKNSEIKNAWLAGVVVFGCMAIIIGCIILYYLKRSRSHIRKLTQLNGHMRSAMNALKQSQEENKKLLKVVAHDLRNPINSINAIADLMMADPARSDDDRQLLEMLKTSGNNSLQLVKDLLQTNAQSNLEKAPADMAQLLHYCVDMLQHKAQEKHQRLVLHTTPVTIFVNQEKIWRVFTNLIANAIKFSPDRSAIDITLESIGKEALISVADQGIGIAPGMRGKLFDLFTEAQRPGTAGEESFGIGLSVTRQIVEAHGGRIWFDSEEGKGTTFFIALPLA